MRVEEEFAKCYPWRLRGEQAHDASLTLCHNGTTLPQVPTWATYSSWSTEDAKVQAIVTSAGTTLQDEQLWPDAIEKHFIEHVGQCSNEEELATPSLAIEALPFGSYLFRGGD